jgi:hypothetical protein
MKLLFDKEPVDSIGELLLRYKPGEFESPTRSTVPLLSLAKHDQRMWNRIAEIVGIPDAIEAHFEFTVDPVRGTGNPSHTDVMLMDGCSAVAIEAKWTEPPYDTVGIWLASGSNLKNRQAVCEGWLSLIQPHSSSALHLASFEAVTYQMVHRAASACGLSRKPALAYLQFSPLPSGGRPEIAKLQSQLSRLSALLGFPSNFPFSLVEVETKPTGAFRRISGLPKSSRETAKIVREALAGEPLFEFTNVIVHPLQKASCP